MANPVLDIPTFDREAYLAFEDAATERHELIGGVAYAMTGGTGAHNLIAMNLAAALHGATRGGPCQVFQQGMKLRVATDLAENFFYPDVMVCCDPGDDASLWRDRPTLIAEVLSPSTARIDRGEKLILYTGLPSLREYIVIGAEMARVTRYRRADGWAPEAIDLNAGERLEAADVALSFDLLYEGVRF